MWKNGGVDEVLILQSVQANLIISFYLNGFPLIYEFLMIPVLEPVEAQQEPHDQLALHLLSLPEGFPGEEGHAGASQDP